MRTPRFTLALVASLVLSAPATALEVKLTVSDDAGADRKPGTVTSGVPFARGALTDVAKLSVSAGGKKIPAQFRKLAVWEDGSVRWALVDCQVELAGGGKAELVLRDDGGNVAPSSPVKVAESPGEVRVSTGPLEAVIDTKSFNLFKSVKVDGKELVTSAGRGLVLYTEGELKTETPVDSRGRKGRPVETRAPGKPLPAAAPDEVVVEEAGPVRAVLLLRGKYPGVHQDLVRYTVRLTAFAGQKFLKLHVWLENGGAHGYCTGKEKPRTEWFAFDGMAVELGLGLGGAVTAECEGAKGSGKLRVYQYCKNAKTYPEPAYGYKLLEYTITSGGEELKKGQHTDGAMALSGPGGGLNVAVRNFWENYEKAMELDGSTLRVWLWPLEGQFPRKFFDHHCPGYANSQIHPLWKLGVYNMPGSVHKGYETILDFSGRGMGSTLAELSRPLFAAASPEHYASTQAAPVIFAPPGTGTGDGECDEKLAAWTRMTRSAVDPKTESSIWHGRTTHESRGNAFFDGYWYGWMEFGDIPDPGQGYTSLHYDWPLVMGLSLMRTGDLGFLRMGAEMMRHRTEVDQGWSDREIEECRGLPRPGYGYTQYHCARFTGPWPTIDGTWLAGMVLQYMLTGDPKTREAVERTAQFIVPAWERMAASKEYGVRVKLGDMQMAARSIHSSCALYALTGERKWLDFALKIFRERVEPKWKNHGPHLHDRQQIRSQDYTKDDIKYCYSIAAFCLLHHYTGEKRVLELVTAGCDQDFPPNFFDAPLFLADLHAYAALVTGKEDYADDAVELWIQASPESKCPPVFLPGDSVWSTRAPTHMSAGHILQYYFWKKGKK